MPSLSVLAQRQPDAGAIQRDYEHIVPPAARAVPPAVVTPGQPLTPPAVRSGDSAPLVKLAQFAIDGVSVFEVETLSRLLDHYVGRTLSLGELEQAVGIITRYYRERGYIAALAILPEQVVNDGVVHLKVFEGKVSEVLVEPSGRTRLDPEQVAATVRAGLVNGLVHQTELEQALLRLNALPGVKVAAVLSQGTEPGTTRLIISLEEGALLAGAVTVHNQGSASTGRLRSEVVLDLNDAAGRGDLFRLNMARTSSSDYLRWSHVLPVDRRGTRVGIAASVTRYTLCCQFAALGASGNAASVTVHLGTPLVSTDNTSLDLYAAADANRLRSDTVAGNSQDRRTRMATLGVNLLASSAQPGVVALTGLAYLSTGTLDLSANAADQAQDAATARAEGHFSKWRVEASLVKPWRAGLEFSVSGSSQWSNRNLDSSQKFSLGGPGAVRAYPVGEASGDQGAMLSAEARWRPAKGWQLSLFTDAGLIRLQQQPWSLGSAAPNRYVLRGMGLGINYTDDHVRAQLLIARRTGANPGASAAGLDSDGRSPGLRLWAQVSRAF
jgi:hemolysin activation/secretion protein